MVLELYNEASIRQIYEYRSMPEIYSAYCLQPKSEDELRQYLKSCIHDNESTSYQITIIKTEDKVIGEIALKRWGKDKKVGEIGFAINPRFQRKGYAFSALKQFIETKLISEGMIRIQACINPDNTSSKNLLMKLGFKRDGILRDVEYNEEKDMWENEEIYSVIRKDVVS